MVWYGVLWYGVVWCGMVWYGMVWNFPFVLSDPMPSISQTTLSLLNSKYCSLPNISQNKTMFKLQYHSFIVCTCVPSFPKTKQCLNLNNRSNISTFSHIPFCSCAPCAPVPLCPCAPVYHCPCVPFSLLLLCSLASQVEVGLTQHGPPPCYLSSLITTNKMKLNSSDY